MTVGTGSLISAIRCPSCGNTVPVSQFCPKCGGALPQGIPCPHCGKISKFGSHCSNCGRPLERVIASKDFELNDLRDLGNVLSGTVSPGIAAARTPASFAEQIKAIALRLLSQTGNKTPFDLRQMRAGSFEFIVGDSSYASVEETPDANVKNAIRQAVAEWQKQD